MYPFVHNDNRKDYLEKIKDYIKSKDKRFMKYYKYFVKNWCNNKSYNFNRISYSSY